jgi:hypothetical protein
LHLVVVAQEEEVGRAAIAKKMQILSLEASRKP